jgi:hypothetical protein
MLGERRHGITFIAERKEANETNDGYVCVCVCVYASAEKGIKREYFW